VSRGTKTRQEHEMDLNYAMEAYANAIRSEQAAKDERGRAHARLVDAITAALDFVPEAKP